MRSLFGQHISQGIYDAWHGGERLEAFTTVTAVAASIIGGTLKLIQFII